jgi:HEPN domain-containing protein
MSAYQEILEAPKLFVPEAEADKWVQEERAFFRQLPELLKTKRGKWVAIHEERVVEIGDSLREVLISVRKRYPKTEAYIQLVDEKLPVAKMMSPKRGAR